MSEDIFDMEVAKAKGEKFDKKEVRKSSESKKRSSVVDSDDEAEKQPAKKVRPEGPLSPNSRRMSTSFEKRQSERRKSATKLQLPSSEPKMEQDQEGIISQLDLHPSAVSI